MQWIVSGVEIEDDLFLCLPMRFEDVIDEQRHDRRRVMGDLVVVRGARPARAQDCQRCAEPPRGGLRRDRSAKST
jgi:hypothetical protein